MRYKLVKTYKDLIVWEKEHGLVLAIYKRTQFFPNSEKVGLVSQMRRASVSVACNIVEGFSRVSNKESKRFYNISNASLE